MQIETTESPEHYTIQERTLQIGEGDVFASRNSGTVYRVEGVKIEGATTEGDGTWRVSVRDIKTDLSRWAESGELLNINRYNRTVPHGNTTIKTPIKDEPTTEFKLTVSADELQVIAALLGATNVMKWRTARLADMYAKARSVIMSHVPGPDSCRAGDLGVRS